MKEQRLDLLEQYILDNHTVTIDSICETQHISKNTARRYIDELAGRGNITKVYGGAKTADTKTPLSSFEERHYTHAKEKDYICRLAAGLVSDGDVIYIDTGTTCVNLVEHLKTVKCTIITNSLPVATKAIPYKNLKILILPGELNRDTLSFAGLSAINSLNVYNIDKAFMVSTGVTMENGLTNASTDEYSIKKAAAERSHLLYLLSDYSKFGRTALHTYCSLSEVDTIITDRRLPEKYLAYCTAHNINIVF